MKTGKIRIFCNSPVIIGFTILSLIVLLLGDLTGGQTDLLLFSVYRAPLTDPLTYVRLFGHVLGHADWAHFMGNVMLILVIGPLLEEKYGPLNLLFVILSAALLTGLVNYICFPHVRLLGASGVVFAFILLSSFASMRENGIPLTLLLVAAIYIGGQIYDGIMVRDNVSNLSHILGGLTGALLGYVMNRNKMNRY